jgi:ribosomal protein S18 acetylase RimI-like enzyme
VTFEVSTAAVTLRPSGPDDREFLFTVYERTRTEELAVLPWTEEQKQAFLRFQAEAQDTDYRARRPDARFLVVVADGTDVGRLYRAELDGELELMDIALLPEWRGQGIGSLLLEDLLAEADARGLTVTLYVEHWNPARRLYDRLGFVAVGQDDVYLRMERQPQRPA